MQPTVGDVHVPVPGRRRPGHLLKNLRLGRIDLVDNGASQDPASGQGAHVMLYKRDVSADERQALADKGQAMPDGSYPIANVGDLKNAIQAFGRAKNPDAVKAHIKSRARALGATDLLPESWSTSKRMVAMLNTLAKRLGLQRDDAQQLATEAGLVVKQDDGDDGPITFAEANAAQNLDDLFDDYSGDMAALKMTIADIMSNGADMDKVRQAVADFNKDVAEDIDQWLGNGATVGKGADMNTVKQQTEPEPKPAPKPSTQDPEDAGLHQPEDEELKEPDTKGPKEPSNGAANKREPTMAEPVTTATLQKRLDEQQAENERLRKRVDDQENVLKAEREKSEQREYIGKCADFPGLVLKADDDWKMLREVYQKLSPEASKRWTEVMKAASHAIVTGDLFKQMGSSNGAAGNGSAWGEIEALAEGMVAKATNGLTKPQAVERVCREHPELYKRHQDEQRARSINALPR